MSPPNTSSVRRNGENRLRSLVDTILDTIIDGVITINTHGEIQSYNKACAKLFGYSADEVLGKNVNILMPQPYRAEHDGYLDNYQRTKVAKIIGIGREVSGQRKDGSVFPMELAVGKTDQGGEHAYVGIIRDITERREAEKAQEQLRQSQKMEALGQLTGGIAHDFNNLLAVILGNLDFLHERTQDDAQLNAYIQPSIAAAEHGAELTKQLLAFSRKQALQPRVISINELLDLFKPFIHHSLGERIEVIMKVDPDIWNINVDPTQIQNVLLNLAVNARDAMPNGGILIYETKNIILDEFYTDGQPEMTPGEYVMIAISDTGCGMSPDVVEKAFEPFFTTKEVGKGTGLGLSMVYGFVKQSKGHVNIYSELGHGTTIRIYLPKANGPYDSKQKRIHATAESRHSDSRIILVVEDNAEVLKITSAMVKSMGYIVIEAPTGDDALNILKERNDICMLLSDVMLPGEINGPTLAKKALNIHPGLKVLFNSGYAEHAIFKSGLLEEGVHLISKPFRKDQLAERISELLK